MTVINASVATLTNVATMKMIINPTDKVTATPMMGNNTKITKAVTNAVIMIAPMIKNAFVTGLVTSLPLIIIRVAMTLSFLFLLLK